MGARLFASAVFLVQRALHMAIAIYAVALALQQIVGWPVWACVAIVGGLTTLYTVFGYMIGPCAMPLLQKTGFAVES